jgi:epoxyqueuosine reductase
MTAAELSDRLREPGVACAVVDIGRLAELREEIGRHAGSGALDSGFVEERLGFFDFRPPRDFPSARSIIVTAVPLPQSRVWFHWRGDRVPVTVPPAYIGFDQAGRMVRDLLGGILAPAGYRVETVLLPEKAVAARAGLAAYGRNNIVYVPGMGSLLRLATFYSDLPAEGAAWHAPRMLPRCEHCRTCARACPTGAMEEDRFLLHAERCLVFHNERPGTIPLPDWIPAQRNGCLVGCMECQRVCPENLPYLGNVIDSGEFSGPETQLLLDGCDERDLPPQLLARLRGSDLMCQLHVLSRNLRAVLPNAAAPAR